MFIHHHTWSIILSMFVLWLAALALGGWLVARLFPTLRRPNAEDDRAGKAVGSAVRTVRQRYASGELTRDEYEELLRTLG